MKMQNVLVLMILCHAGVATAGKVAVMPVTGVNTPPDHQAVIGAVFAEAYVDASGHEVLLPDEVAPVLDQAESASAAARELGCEEYIELSVVGLSSKMALRAARYSADGIGLHQVRMTATSLDDVATVAERMARALVAKSSTDETRDLDNVVASETHSNKRLFTESIIGLRFTGTAWIADGVKLDPYFSLQFVAKFEAENFLIEIGAGAFLPSMGWRSAKKYGGLIGEVGASYYILNREVSLYLGGGLSPRLIGGDDNFGVRLAVYGQLGAMFFRSSSTRMFAELRVGQHLVPFGSGSQQVWDPSLMDYVSTAQSEFFPTEFTLSVGVGF